MTNEDKDKDKDTFVHDTGSYTFNHTAPDHKEPEELLVIIDEDKKVSLSLDGIDLPFACEVQVENHITQDLAGNHYNDGSDITLTIRPKRLVMRMMNDDE